jgi:OmcA/MtrC family decaheme c-type cytochrome
MCVTCHTDQVKGTSDLAANVSTANVFPATLASTANGYLMDTESTGDFPIMIHKFHMSSSLVKSGASYVVNSTSYSFPTKTPLNAAGAVKVPTAKDCSQCHTSNKTALDEDNWKTKPTRLACGSCHDGMNWATGALYKVLAKTTLAAHAGGAQTSDANCAGCHTAASIAAKHGQ